MVKRGTCIIEFRQYFHHSYSDFFQIWSAQHCVARFKDRFLQVKVKDKEMLYCIFVTWFVSFYLALFYVFKSHYVFLFLNH